MANPCSRLEVVAPLVERYVPIFKSGQWDPVIAAESGSGSCLAKNVFAAVALSCLATGLTAAIQWNEEDHPRSVAVLDSDSTDLLSGHTTLLAGRDSEPTDITELSFNDKLRRSTDWRIGDFNQPDEEPYALVANGVIVATEQGAENGVHIHPWYDAGQRYTEALGITDSVFHVLAEDEIREAVLSCLRRVAVPRETPI